ncbi:hypothetical protein NHF48_007240 [Sphingomonas sp. H160509]|uniref:hypothetical protein n=1 Tax=Sphingomonas sp. H160509 TaxID=2955313 RepID=UPI0021E958A9|nr:hypothetical protein [Sphingomonas sp. H160509]MDD1450795.1 hypothetical protein [Sphingomonas sp. H160509]
MALLDRRLVALENVQFAVNEFWIAGAARQDSAAKVSEALRIAELVFDDKEKAAVERFLQQIYKWQELNRRLDTYRDRGDPRFQAVCDELFAFEDTLTDGFVPVLTTLREAIRVRSIPALAPPTSWRSTLKRLRRAN